MKITVDSNLMIKNIFEPPISIQFTKKEVNLRELIKRLGDICYMIEFLFGSELGNDVNKLTLNNTNFLILPHGLNTPLKDGDVIYVDILWDSITGG